MKITGISHGYAVLIIPLLFAAFLLAPGLNTLAGESNEQNDLLSSLEQNTQLRLIESKEEAALLEFISAPPQFETSLIDNQLCETVNIPDLIQSDIPSAPALPVKGSMLGIPGDAHLTIKILEAESTDLPGSHVLCPSAKPILNRTAQGFMELAGYGYERGPAYQINAWTPSTSVELASTGYIRSQRFAQIQFYPVQYNPVSGELRYYRRLLVKVEFNSDRGKKDGTKQVESMQVNSIHDEGSFEASLHDVLINYEQARAWRIPPSTSTPISAGATATLDKPEYKIEINQDGLYQISYADLLEAGVTSEELNRLDPQTFQVFNQENEVAISVEGEADHVFDPGEYLLFYGQRLDTRYTNTNVYWLSWGTTNGIRMQSLDGTPSGSANMPSEFQTTQHAEEDIEYYQEESSGPDHDHWYWGTVYAWNAPAYLDFPTELSHISSINPTVTVSGLLEGYTASPNHHTKIYLNGHLIDDHSFSTGSEYLFNITNVPTSYLKEGENKLRVECPRDGSITVDAVLANWFEIDYFKSYFAESNRLFFDGDQAGNWEFRIDGFSSASLEVYDITDPLNPLLITGGLVQPTSNGQRISFETTITDEHHYIAQATSQRLSPLSISLDNPSDLKSTANGADYIIISHSDFITEVQTLATYHSSQGLRAQVVDVQDVYDEFNGGVFSPEAIKSFLDYAYHHWITPAPSFVLLVGDGNYDFKNNLGWNEENYIPPYLDDVDPWIGETATDNRFVTISGDDILPDMYIGRFPVKTAAEAQTMVEKVINYEQVEPSGGWNAKQLFVADNKDSAGNFPVLSDGIINTYIPDWYTVDKVYYGSPPYTDSSVARAAIKTAINDGRLIVHYLGHGGVQDWASESLLKETDITLLTNGSKLPFIIPLTCSEGYFIFPSPAGADYSSIGETFVRINGKGAIASWSPTGWGSSKGHDLLDRSVYSDLFISNQTQLGYLTTHAKYYLYAKGIGYYELIETYILFGDPALRLQAVSIYPIFLPLVVKK
jgi:hypothetical protein